MRREFGTIKEIRRGELYRVFWQENGRKRSHNVRGGRADASRYLAKVQLGIRGADDATTYDEYWAAVIEPSLSSLAPRTAADYRRLWGILSPMMGRMRVAGTTARAVQTVVDRVPAPRTRQQCRTLLHKVCAIAVSRDRLLDYNPVDGVAVSAVPRREKTLWDVEAAKSAMAAMRGTKYEPLVLLSLSCGLRPEECFALDWEDLSFSDGYCAVAVRRTSVLVDGKPVVSERTKTERSRRTAVCGGAFAARLEELARENSGAICRRADGGRTSPSTISRNWKAWCGRHGVPHVTFENLRTNYKTLCAQAMVPAEIVRMQMGHSGVGVAERHYLVATEPILRAAADMFCALFE